MKLSDKGLKLIAGFEGCVLKAYRCEANVLTIGYGHTGKDVVEGMTISVTEAEALLKKDAAKFERGVTKLCDFPVTQNQFDALVSLAFNIGLANMATATILKMLRVGNVQAAAELFLRWNKIRSNGELVVSKGLSKRRMAERQYFLQA